MFSRSRLLAMESLIVLAFVGISATSLADEPEGDTPKFTPGQEVTIDREGNRGYFLVYTPSDYTPERAWPVIFNFHGLNGKPTTRPFKQVTGGAAFIVVGMDYRQEEYTDYSLMDNEVRNLLEISAMVGKELNVDKSMVFIGGFSQGGYTTSIVAEKLLAHVTGFLVLGAGRVSSGGSRVRGLIQGKPVFVGAGEMDTEHLPRAQKAAETYHKMGADVTFEVWKGLGHQVDAKSEKMRDWLYAYGPLRKVRALIDEAKKADKGKRFGKAYTLYEQAAGLLPSTPTCQEAAAAAEKIAAAANATFAEVEQLLDSDDRTKALRKLAELKRRYTGCQFGEKAAEMLEATK